MTSVVQSWLVDLPLMQQTVLLCALRGPDGMAKEGPWKKITRHLRRVILHNARPVHESSFMLGDTRLDEDMALFLVGLDGMPIHYVLHVAHAAEIIGHKHPDPYTAGMWQSFYDNIVDAFHMNPETLDQLDTRLNR